MLLDRYDTHSFPLNINSKFGSEMVGYLVSKKKVYSFHAIAWFPVSLNIYVYKGDLNGKTRNHIKGR